MDDLLILVIEDEPDIQAIIDDDLSDGGYKPAIATSGEEAIALLNDGQTKYQMLVTDINLAGRTDGWQVARAAREIDPNFPVIYMTGAAAHLWTVHGVPKSVLLAKPFAPAQLVTAISNLLNTGGPPVAAWPIEARRDPSNSAKQCVASPPKTDDEITGCPSGFHSASQNRRRSFLVLTGTFQKFCHCSFVH